MRVNPALHPRLSKFSPQTMKALKLMSGLIHPQEYIRGYSQIIRLGENRAVWTNGYAFILYEHEEIGEEISFVDKFLFPKEDSRYPKFSDILADFKKLETQNSRINFLEDIGKNFVYKPFHRSMAMFFMVFAEKDYITSDLEGVGLLDEKSTLAVFEISHWLKFSPFLKGLNLEIESCQMDRAGMQINFTTKDGGRFTFIQAAIVSNETKRKKRR